MVNSSIYLGKLESFTNLNFAAIKGDDFPKKKPWFPGSGEQWGRSNFPRFHNHGGYPQNGWFGMEIWHENWWFLFQETSKSQRKKNDVFHMVELLWMEELL